MGQKMIDFFNRSSKLPRIPNRLWIFGQKSTTYTQRFAPEISREDLEKANQVIQKLSKSLVPHINRFITQNYTELASLEQSEDILWGDGLITVEYSRNTDPEKSIDELWISLSQPGTEHDLNISITYVLEIGDSSLRLASAEGSADSISSLIAHTEAHFPSFHRLAYKEGQGWV
jgi:hypothetical protein